MPLAAHSSNVPPLERSPCFLLLILFSLAKGALLISPPPWPDLMALASPLTNRRLLSWKIVGQNQGVTEVSSRVWGRLIFFPANSRRRSRVTDGDGETRNGDFAPVIFVRLHPEWRPWPPPAAFVPRMGIHTLFCSAALVAP